MADLYKHRLFHIKNALSYRPFLVRENQLH